MSVGMPQHMMLNEFGTLVEDAFGHKAYLVGSATRGKDWRDVDVRLILPDDEYERLGLGAPHEKFTCARWASLCRAYSALGKDMTGLPIDFQIQQMSNANAKHPSGDREPLGIKIYDHHREPSNDTAA